MELMHQGVVLSLIGLELLTVWNATPFFCLLGSSHFARAQQLVYLFSEECLDSVSKQNGSTWRISVVLNWKLPGFRNEQYIDRSAWIYSCVCRSSLEVAVPVTYNTSFRCTQSQICLCGPSGGVNHDIVLWIWCVFSYAFMLIYFER